MKVVQSCPTLCEPMDSAVHGILQPRILEWVAFPFSRGSSQPRDWTQVSLGSIAGRFFTNWATREAPFIWLLMAFHWKDWCWSWNCSTLATSCEELTHWKRPWCWEGLGAGGEGDNRGWDGRMATPTRWTWVWVNSGSWWRTGRPGVLWFMGSQRVRHDWATELNWMAFHKISFNIYSISDS